MIRSDHLHPHRPAPASAHEQCAPHDTKPQLGADTHKNPGFAGIAPVHRHDGVPPSPVPLHVQPCEHATLEPHEPCCAGARSAKPLVPFERPASSMHWSGHFAVAHGRPHATNSNTLVTKKTMSTRMAEE